MVRESVYEGQFQPPQTQKAARTIPLGPHVVSALIEHQARASRCYHVWWVVTVDGNELGWRSEPYRSPAARYASNTSDTARAQSRAVAGGGSPRPMRLRHSSTTFGQPLR